MSGFERWGIWVWRRENEDGWEIKMGSVLRITWILHDQNTPVLSIFDNSILQNPNWTPTNREARNPKKQKPEGRTPNAGRVKKMAGTIWPETLECTSFPTIPIRYYWEIQYSRFFNYPCISSTSPILRPLPTTKRIRTHGTWVSSPTASLHLLSHHSSAELVLVVSLQDKIHVSCSNLRVDGFWFFLFIEMDLCEWGLCFALFLLTFLCCSWIYVIKLYGSLSPTTILFFVYEIGRIWVNG